MVGVNGMNGRDAPVVPLLKAGMSWICGFVQDVVARNPGIPLIVFRKFFPEPDCTVLEVFVNPKGSYMGRVICMPILEQL